MEIYAAIRAFKSAIPEGQNIGRPNALRCERLEFIKDLIDGHLHNRSEILQYQLGELKITRKAQLTRLEPGNWPKHYTQSTRKPLGP